MILSVFAPAKVNLSLRVRGRRADGFHELESLVAFASVGDILELHHADRTTFESAPPDARDNNIVTAAHAALEARVGCALPVRLRLEKKLPIAAGLGGGSADAAACFRGLNRLFELGLSFAELSALGEKLGADVPVCLAAMPHYMTGIGEKLTPKKLPPADIVLVHPRVSLPTKKVFAALEASENLAAPSPPLPDFSVLETLADFVRGIGNDLTTPALKIVPQIADCLSVLENLSGCSYAAMSGSGAACFGLFPLGAGAGACVAYRQARPQDWAEAGCLIGAGDTKIHQVE